MAKKRELVRKNVFMSVEIAQYIEEMSEKMGISQSALMVTAIKGYIDQQEALQFARSVPDWFKQVQMFQEGSQLSIPQSPEDNE